MLITAPNPSVRSGCAAIVQHQAWRQSRSALLEAASAGPATLALLGAAGTGKSWLLRDIETILRKHGQAVTLVRQGDLPWQLERGTILLIDEASRMSDEALALLASQRTAIVILAALPNFAATLALQSPAPRIIRMAPLDLDQVTEFIAGWLRLAGRQADAVTADAVARLAHHSGGTPRLVTRLLNAAFAFATDSSPITGAAIDEVASLRWSGVAPSDANAKPIATPAPAPPNPIGPRSRQPRPRRARRVAAAAALTALAAAALLALRMSEPPHQNGIAALANTQPMRDLEAASVPPPSPAFAAPIGLIATAAPELASALAPPLALSTEPPLPLPELASVADSIAPLLADLPLPSALSAEVALARLPERSIPTTAAPETGPGLILVARRGDTLRELYANLYRGVEPPPFEEVVAANPHPVVPGTVIIFPAPIGGWPR